jgi:hypothetical protein
MAIRPKTFELPRRCISNPYARLWSADHGHELPERFAPILLRPERFSQEKPANRSIRRAGESLVWAHEFRTTRKQNEDLPISLHPQASATALPSFAGSKRKIKMLSHREGAKNAKQSRRMN